MLAVAPCLGGADASYKAHMKRYVATKTSSLRPLGVLPVVAAVMAFAIPVAFSAPLQAQQPPPAAVSACAALTNDGARLACYDGLFRGEAEETTSLVIRSEQQILARPSGRDYATMTLICEDGSPRLEFAFAGNPLSSIGSNIGISVKRDLRSGSALSLAPSSGGLSAVMTSPRDLASFVQSLEGIAALTVESRTTDYRSVSARFQIGPRQGEMAATLASCE